MSKKIIISEGITEIGDRALGFTVNATEVSIPNSMEKISYSALKALICCKTKVIGKMVFIIAIGGY